MLELFRLSASELALRLRTRELSAVEVVTAHQERIEAVNPHINALVQLAPDALEQARQADADIARGSIHGPLHGVPFTVKDVLDAAGVVGAVGQAHRSNHVPAYDAIVVARLRQAGAILLGKTNCPPGGSGGDTENVIYGRTLNPYDLARTPGGSSGGEAALIAAGGSPLGLGTDSGGGTRVPAHYCGVAALKPTTGRVPNTGAYDQPGGLSDPRSQIGPIARTVADLALTLAAISGPDNFDSGVMPVPLGDREDVCLAEQAVAYFGEDPNSPVTNETGHVVGAAAQALARAGVLVEQNQPRDLVRDARTISEVWNELASLRGQDVVEFFNEWDYFRSRMLQYMERYDAILCPVDSHPAPAFKERDPRRFDYTAPFSLTGWPAVVVRAGVLERWHAYRCTDCGQTLARTCCAGVGTGCGKRPGGMESATD